MRTLTNFHQQQQEANLALGQQIEALAQQLKDLQQMFRVQENLAKSQQTFNHQFEKQIKGLISLLKDACSLYPVEALDNLKSELNEIFDEVKEDYENLSKSDRFLNATDDEIEDNIIQLKADAPELLAIEENKELPPEDDDRQLLTPEQVEKVIEALPSKVINQIKSTLNIHGKIKDLGKISEQIAKIPVTHKKLLSFIKGIEDTLSFQTQLLV